MTLDALMKSIPWKRSLGICLLTWFLIVLALWATGWSPYARLLNGIDDGDVKRVVAELNNGINPNDMPDDDEAIRPICAAATHGNIEIVKLLVAHGAKIDEGDAWVSSPLEAAAMNEHIDVMAFLVKWGARVNDDGEGRLLKGGSYPLWQSALEGKLRSVKWLLAHGANPNTVTNEKFRLLEMVNMDGRPDIADVLRKAGAK